MITSGLLLVCFALLTVLCSQSECWAWEASGRDDFISLLRCDPSCMLAMSLVLYQVDTGRPVSL